MINNSTKQPPAIVLGLSPTGLYAIRELAREGIEVFGITDSKQAGCASRYLTDYIMEPDDQLLLPSIINYFKKYDCRPVLIPTSDRYIDFIIMYSDKLSEYFEFQGSYKNGIANTLLTKESFYELCDEHNILYPKLWKSNLDEINSLKDIISYPCMIKPSRIHEIKSKMVGKKGWVVEELDKFDEVIKTIPQEAGTLLLQEIVGGSESEITLYCSYFSKKYLVHQSFTCRKLRQYPPGFGSASIAQSCEEKDTIEISESFLKAVGYQGIAATEFKRDPLTGQLKIIEINTRPSLWFSISTASNKNVTLACYHDLANTNVTLQEHKQIMGVRWRYVLKDIYSALFYKFNNRFLLPPPDLKIVGAAIKKEFAVFSFDDPKPALSEIINLISKLIQKVKGN